MFTCSKCNITLSSHEELKSHCGCKWHAYNLMRATQGKQPITVKAFEIITQELLHHKQSFNEEVTLSCKPCNKTFSSEGTFSSHLQSRSHRAKAANYSPDPTQEQHGWELAAPGDEGQREVLWAATRFADLSDDVEEESCDSDSSWEVLSDGEGDEDIRPASWPCLLCPLSCDAALNTLQHMREEHSFSVPHREGCDLRRLYTRLADTVLQLRRCLQCGRQFPNVVAVQRHMADKPHLTINPLSKQYRSCYRAAVFASRLELPETSPDSCLFELTLSSGARLTPRSLALYTRQHLRQDATEPRARQRRLALQQEARQTSSGALQTTAQHRSSLHKQQLAECRRRGPQLLAIGTRGNALRHRIRAQVERAG